MSGEVNCPRFKIDIHEIVDNPTLDVTFVFVHKNFSAGVVDLHEAEFVLQVFIEGLVLFLVMLNALFEIVNNRHFAKSNVVWTVDLWRKNNNIALSRYDENIIEACLDALDVALYDALVITNGFHEEKLETLFLDNFLMKQLSPIHCGIGGIKPVMLIILQIVYVLRGS